MYHTLTYFISVVIYGNLEGKNILPDIIYVQYTKNYVYFMP